MPNAEAAMRRNAAPANHYAVISLDEFAGLDLIILESQHYRDFTIISAVERGGRRITAVVGVLHGTVCMMPLPVAAAIPAATEGNDLSS